MITVDDQQPQRLEIAAGAHLRGMRAGEPLPGGADRIERIALTGKCTRGAEWQ